MLEKEKVAADVELTLTEPSEPDGRRRTTTRLELWAFYVYYIVSHASLLTRPG